MSHVKTSLFVLCRGVLCIYQPNPFGTSLFKISLLFILVIAPQTLFAQADFTHNIPALQQDFNLFRSALEQSHAGIYWHRSKSEMDNYFDAAYAKIDHNMTELEFYRILAPLISKIGCGHTWIATTEPTQEKIWEEGKVLPLKLKFLEGKAYCIQNNGHDSTSVILGDEVLRINQYSIDSLLKLSNHFSPGDGFIEVGKWKLLIS